jgi:hypothetical protein
MQGELNLAYALEKFGEAINDLANEPGNPRDWLKAASTRFWTVRPTDLPEGELRTLFVRIMADLTSDLRKMSDKNALELVNRIVSFYRRLRSGNTADEPRVQVIIHTIIEPVRTPDGERVKGGRRVGAIATILGTNEKTRTRTCRV